MLKVHINQTITDIDEFIDHRRCWIHGVHVVRYFCNYPNYNIYNLDCLSYAGNLDNLSDIKDYKNYYFLKENIKMVANLKLYLKSINLKG